MTGLARVVALAAGTWLAAAVPARGQAPVDSTRLARAIAAVVVEDMLAGYRPELVPVLMEPTERLEALIARELATMRPFRGLIRDLALAVELRVSAAPGLPWLEPELRALPAVLVTSTACERSESWGGRGHRWSNQVLLVFRPSGEGWEVAKAMTLGNADGSCRPRGEPAPRQRSDGM